MKPYGSAATRCFRRCASRSLFVVWVCLAIWTLAPQVPAEWSGWNIKVVGQLGGSCLGVKVHNGYAYLGEGPNLTVLDVSATTNPTVVTKVRFNGGVIGEVFIENDYAYVPAGSDGLYILDISDPTSPQILSHYENFPHNVFVSSNTAYTPLVPDSLDILDVTDRSSTPTLIATTEVGTFVYRVYIADWVAYLSLGDEGLDIRDLDPPYMTITMLEGESVRDVRTSGSLAYVAARDFTIVDTTHLASSTIVSTYTLRGSGSALHFADPLIYVGTTSGSVHVINVSDPTSPTGIARWDGAVSVQSMDLEGGFLYVADSLRGVHILDVSDPTSLTRVGFYSTPVGIHVIRIPSASHGYIGAYDFYAVDINDPAHPAVFSIYETPKEVAGIDTSGNNAFLTHNQALNLMVLNIGDPASMTLVGVYESEQRGRTRRPAEPKPKIGTFPQQTLPRVTVRGNKAIIAGFTSGSLELLDIGQPSSPTFRSLYPVLGFVGDIDIQGNTAFISNGAQGLKILDISDPASGTLSGRFAQAWALSFHNTDVTGYVGDGGEGVWIIDLNDVSSPPLVNRYLCPGPTYGLDESGGLLFTASDRNGLHVVDITDPTSPILTGHFDSEGLAVDVRYHGDLIYLADQYTGLWILRYTGPKPGTAGTATRQSWRLYR